MLFYVITVWLAKLALATAMTRNGDSVQDKNARCLKAADTAVHADASSSSRLSHLCQRCNNVGFQQTTCDFEKCTTANGIFTGGRCECAEGWHGERCDKRLCRHGTPNAHFDRCDCEDGWTGERCDTISCYNGRPNQAQPGEEMRCECFLGFAGRHCEHATAVERRELLIRVAVGVFVFSIALVAAIVVIAWRWRCRCCGHGVDSELDIDDLHTRCDLSQDLVCETTALAPSDASTQGHHQPQYESTTQTKDESAAADDSIRSGQPQKFIPRKSSRLPKDVKKKNSVV